MAIKQRRSSEDNIETGEANQLVELADLDLSACSTSSPPTTPGRSHRHSAAPPPSSYSPANLPKRRLATPVPAEPSRTSQSLSLSSPCAAREVKLVMAEFQNPLASHTRNDARHELSENIRCPLCAEDILPDIEAFRAHVRADEPKHSTLTGDADIVEAFRKMAINAPKQSPGSTSPKRGATSSTRSPRKKQSLKHSEDKDITGSRKADQPMKFANPDLSTSSPKPKKARSPPSSPVPPSSPPTTPGRSHRHSGVTSDFDRGDAKNFTSRQLWNPADEPNNRVPRDRPSTSRRVRQGPRPPLMDLPCEVHPADITTTPGFVPFRQPETKTITQERLITEIKGIFDAVTEIENRCIEVCGIPKSEILTVEQYQKLIGLHRTLLHQHHDFFLASQHPAANNAIRRLPARLRMPRRMWEHGIQSFLEFLRKRLPSSHEHMLTFVCIAYSVMALFYETIPGFVATWIECLGDLGRYRMAIEEDDPRDREHWSGESRRWYSKASDRSPEVGRLYHHLAILARPNPLQQLYYYNKSLCVPDPFPSAKGSIMTLFKPVLERTIHLKPHDEVFIRIHAIFFSRLNEEELDDAIAEFLSTLDGWIAEDKREWLSSGYYIAMSLICSLFGYGDDNNPLKQSLPADPGSGNAATEVVKNVDEEDAATKQFEITKRFAMKTCDVVFQRNKDTNVLPFCHIILVFLHYVAPHAKAMSLIENEFPWRQVVDVLNEAYRALISEPRMESKDFPRPPHNEPLRPLPEDYVMRGFGLSRDYFPSDWFSSDKIEDNEKTFEPPSLGDERRQRLLWLGRQICDLGNWLNWHEGCFTVNPAYDKDTRPSVEG